MKRVISILCIIGMMLHFSSCVSYHVISQKIVTPVSNVIPISGKWKVIRMLDPNVSRKTKKHWVGKYAEFSKNYVSVVDYLFNAPSFKLRTLNAKEYLSFNHKSLESNVKVPDNNADIITITDKDKYLCEILMLNNTTALMEIYNYDILLTKVSDKLDISLYKSLKPKRNKSTNDDYEDKKACIMLGLRSSGRSSNGNKYSYRTLLIAGYGDYILPIQQSNNIFFPRKSGFWKLDIERTKNNGILKDVIHSYNIFIGKNDKEIKVDPLFKPKIIPISVNNKIDYVGNDYISLETTSSDGNNTYVRLGIVPVDSLPNLKPVTLNDIIGRENAIISNINEQNIINVLEGMGYTIDDKRHMKYNLGLFRKNGHWYFKGRINYHIGNKPKYQYYQVNIMPPSNLIFYDDLSLSWNKIIKKVPNAIDAFTSPNKYLALVLNSKHKLAIYRIINNELSTKPLQIISLRPNENIIMSEWATNNYVDNWVKSFYGFK